MSTALILGGGVTGLSAGIHLLLPRVGAASPTDGGGISSPRRQTDPGHDPVFDSVIICEQAGTAGGNLTGWDRDGCHIDNCVHWLTGTNPHSASYPLWERLGVLGRGGLPLLRPESLFSAQADGARVTLWRDLRRTEEEMLALSPADTESIRDLVRAIRSVQGLCGIGGERHDTRTPPSSVPGALASLLPYLSLSTGGLAERFDHPALRQFMTVFGKDHFSALALIIACAHFCAENGDLPVGGSTAMADALVRRFTALGGVLRTSARVTQIIRTKRDGSPGGSVRAVKLAGGEVIPCDALLITADPSAISRHIPGVPLPPKLEKALTQHADTRFSAFHAAFACPTEALTFSGDLCVPLPAREQSILDTGDSVPPADGDAPLSSYACPSVLFRAFTHEPSFAPEGRTVVTATVFCPARLAEDCVSLARFPTRYAAFKKAFASSMTRMLRGVCPKAGEDLKLLDVWTPATYRRFTGAEIGSFMSLPMRPGVLPRRFDGHVPGLDNCLFAGQWLSSPGGLPIAADEGRRAAARLEKAYLAATDGRIRVSMFPSGQT